MNRLTSSSKYDDINTSREDDMSKYSQKKQPNVYRPRVYFDNASASQSQKKQKATSGTIVNKQSSEEPIEVSYNDTELGRAIAHSLLGNDAPRDDDQEGSSGNQHEDDSEDEGRNIKYEDTIYNKKKKSKSSANMWSRSSVEFGASRPESGQATPTQTTQTEEQEEPGEQQRQHRMLENEEPDEGPNPVARLMRNINREDLDDILNVHNLEYLQSIAEISVPPIVTDNPYVGEDDAVVTENKKWVPSQHELEQRKKMIRWSTMLLHKMRISTKSEVNVTAALELAATRESFTLENISHFVSDWAHIALERIAVAIPHLSHIEDPRIFILADKEVSGLFSTICADCSFVQDSLAMVNRTLDRALDRQMIDLGFAMDALRQYDWDNMTMTFVKMDRYDRHNRSKSYSQYSDHSRESGQYFPRSRDGYLLPRYSL